MRLLLVLTASAALPGSRTLPALKLRGGGVQQLPHDAKALAASFVVLGGFDKCVQHLAPGAPARSLISLSPPGTHRASSVWGESKVLDACNPIFSGDQKKESMHTRKTPGIRIGTQSSKSQYGGRSPYKKYRCTNVCQDMKSIAHMYPNTHR